MDRLDLDRLRNRKVAGCGLALTLALAASAGCRTPRSEVPPGPVFSNNGQAPNPVGFGSQPNPADGSAAVPPGGSKFGIPAPGTSPSANYGVPAGGFGAPGTNLGTQSTMPPSLSTPGFAGMSSPGGASNPMTGFPRVESVVVQ